VDYKKVTLTRPELKATYSGIQPKVSSQFEAEEEKPYKSNFSMALIGPNGAKRSKILKELKEEELSERQKERKGQKMNGDKSGNIELNEEGLDSGSAPEMSESTKQLKQQLDIRKQLESEMISKAISAPITVAAKTFAAATNASTTYVTNSGKKLSGICVSEYKSPQEVFKQLNPSPCLLATNGKIPKLGKGFTDGQIIDLNKKWNPKQRALAMIKMQPIVREDPNNPKTKNTLALDEIMKRVESNVAAESSILTPEKGAVPGKGLKRKAQSQVEELEKREADKQRRRDHIQAILNRKSSHAYQAEDKEREEEDKYFSLLEKKEKVDEKLRALTQLEVKVVVCKVCKYMAQSQSDLCKSQGHEVSRGKAMKRWFKCKGCRHRTHTYNALIPSKPCSKCKGDEFEKTSMHTLREGPKLAHEKLLIRGEEVKFLNSIK
jgi:LysM repeat protein